MSADLAKFAGDIAKLAGVCIAIGGVCIAVGVARNCYIAMAERQLQPWVHAVRIVCDKIDVKPRDLPVEILPHLLLGDKRSCSLIEAFGITHVLNVAGKAARTPESSKLGERYKELNGHDEEGYDMLAHQPEASAFIRAAHAANGRCLIHCQAGINRSGALACAELMLHERLPVLEAVNRCKAARGTILTNHSFGEQLVRLAKQTDLLGPEPTLPPGATAPPKKPPRKSAAQALRKVLC